MALTVRFPSNGIVDLVERPPQAEWSCDHQVRLQRCVRSQGPFRSPLPYNLKTGLLIRSSVTEGKRCEEFSNKGEEEAAWDCFCESYGLGGSGSSVDNPEGDFLLLGLLEGRDSDLDGDRNGADPLYFNQSYLGP